MYEDTNCLHNK